MLILVVNSSFRGMVTVCSIGGGDFEASIEFVFANGIKLSIFRVVVDVAAIVAADGDDDITACDGGLRTKFGIIGNGLSRSLIDDVRLWLADEN